MLNKKEIWDMTNRQLMLDFNCTESDLQGTGYVVTKNTFLKNSRFKNLETSFLKVLCLGQKVIISVDASFEPWVRQNLLEGDPEWFLDMENIRKIDLAMQSFGYEINEMPQYYLPKPSSDEEEALFTTKWYDEASIKVFKDDARFEQAFIFSSHFPDVLGVAAVECDEILGMAGASADCECLYQVGIDVLPGHRGHGIGTSLVKQIKDELLKRGKVPFYGTGSSHLHSRNIAINAGFYPAWVELYSKKIKG